MRQRRKIKMKKLRIAISLLHFVALPILAQNDSNSTVTVRMTFQTEKLLDYYSAMYRPCNDSNYDQRAQNLYRFKDRLHEQLFLPAIFRAKELICQNADDSLYAKLVNSIMSSPGSASEEHPQAIAEVYMCQPLVVLRHFARSDDETRKFVFGCIEFKYCVEEKGLDPQRKYSYKNLIERFKYYVDSEIENFDICNQ